QKTCGKPIAYTANHKNLASYVGYNPPKHNAIVNGVSILRRVFVALLKAMSRVPSPKSPLSANFRSVRVVASSTLSTPKVTAKNCLRPCAISGLRASSPSGSRPFINQARRKAGSRSRIQSRQQPQERRTGRSKKKKALDTDAEGRSHRFWEEVTPRGTVRGFCDRRVT